MPPTDLAIVPSEADRLARLEPVDEAARAYVRAARSERTLQIYATHLRHFGDWCRVHALVPMPATPQTVGRYLSYRAQAGIKPATLAQALSALGHAHELAGYESPREHKAVRELMSGIRRTHGVAPAQKAALLGEQVRRMVEALPATKRGTRDRALLLVGFVGAFRRSELVALEVGDLVFSSEGITVTLRRCKTDQQGASRKIGLPYGSTAATCVVRATQSWIEGARIVEGPLFRTVHRSGRVGGPLTPIDVARAVKRSAEAVGIDPRPLAGHSLRAGFSTTAALAGKSVHSIMKTTGHRSVEMVARYVRDAEIFKNNAGSGLL